MLSWSPSLSKCSERLTAFPEMSRWGRHFRPWQRRPPGLTLTITLDSGYPPAGSAVREGGAWTFPTPLGPPLGLFHPSVPTPGSCWECWQEGARSPASRVQPGRGWARLTAEAPQPPYDGPEVASDLEGVSDLERTWTPKQEGRQTFGQSLGRGGWAQNSPQGGPSPAWPRGPDSLQQTTPQTSWWPRAPEEREGERQAASTGAVRADRADPGPPGARARGWGGPGRIHRAGESPRGQTCRNHFRVVNRKRGGQLNPGVLASEMQVLMPTPSHSS